MSREQQSVVSAKTVQDRISLQLLLLQPQNECFPGGSGGEESAFSAGDPGSIPGSGRSPGGEKGYPLQCSGLENSMDCKESDTTE